MRQYVALQNPDSKGLLEVTGKEYRYLRQVLRLCVGDMVNVRLPAGELQNMTVCRVEEDKRRIMMQVCADTQMSDDANNSNAHGAFLGGGNQSAETQPAVQFDLWLFQFIAKSAKMDLIVRQAAECGVSTIVPVIGEFSQAGTTERNFRGERIERIIREARQQSGSSVGTHVVETVTVAQAAELWQKHAAETAGGAALGIVLYERNGQTVPVHTAVARAVSGIKDDAAVPGTPVSCSSDAADVRTIRTAAVVCGAEGGISPAEIEILVSGGFVPVHFETNILRCETAALYGIAALQSAVTELTVWQCRE